MIDHVAVIRSAAYRILDVLSVIGGSRAHKTEIHDFAIGILGALDAAEKDGAITVIPTVTQNFDGTERPTAAAVDFDGCLATNAWPGIGEPNFPLIEFLIAFRASGGQVILWTCRENELLDQALEWCCEYGLEFDAVNENLPSWKAMFRNDTRKIGADYYIDDKAVCVRATHGCGQRIVKEDAE